MLCTFVYIYIYNIHGSGAIVRLSHRHYRILTLSGNKVQSTVGLSCRQTDFTHTYMAIAGSICHTCLPRYQVLPTFSVGDSMPIYIRNTGVLKYRRLRSTLRIYDRWQLDGNPSHYGVWKANYGLATQAVPLDGFVELATVQSG